MNQNSKASFMSKQVWKNAGKIFAKSLLLFVFVFFYLISVFFVAIGKSLHFVLRLLFKPLSILLYNNSLCFVNSSKKSFFVFLSKLSYRRLRHRVRHGIHRRV